MELLKFWRILLRRWAFVVLTAAGVVALTMVVSLKMDRVYASKARIRLEKTSESSTLVPGLSPEFGAFQNIVQNPAYTEATAVGSGEVLNPVIDSLNLMRRVTWLERVTGKRPVQRRLRADELVSESFLTGLLQERIVSVANVANTDVIEITAYDTSLTGAMTLANAVTRSYVNFMQSLKNYESDEGMRGLNRQLIIANEELARKQQMLRDFQEQHHLINVDEQSKSAVTQLATLQSRLADARRRLQSTQERLAELRVDVTKLREPQPVTQQVESSPQIQDLLTRLSTLNAQLQSLLATQTREHPQVQAIEKQIDETGTALQTEVLRNFSIVIADLKAEISQFNRDISGQQVTMNLLPQQEVRLANLQHEVDSAQKNVLAIQASLNAARGARGLNLSNITVLQWGPLPDPQKPYYPTPGLYLVTALFVGLLLGIGLAFLADYMDQSYRTPAGVQAGLHLPLAGMVNDPEAVASAPRGQALSESGALELGHNVSRLLGEGKTVLLLSSAVPKDRKSPVSAVLATALARRGIRTVLVDLDAHAPAMADATATPGVSAILYDGMSALDAARPAAQPNLSYVGLGTRGPEIVTELDSPQLVRAIAAYRAGFEAVILNGPPLLPNGEGIALTSAVDAVLLVIGLNRTQAPTIAQAKRRLEDAAAPVAGLILSMDSNRPFWR